MKKLTVYLTILFACAFCTVSLADNLPPTISPLVINVMVKNPQFHNLKQYSWIDVSSVRMDGHPYLEYKYNINFQNAPIYSVSDGSFIGVSNIFIIPRVGNVPIKYGKDRTGTYISIRQEANNNHEYSWIPCDSPDNKKIDNKLFPYNDPWISDGINSVIVNVDYASDGTPACHVYRAENN
jgi:hypothetical protein